MKVLHFFKNYLPETFGGVENTIYQLAAEMRRFGVESTVLCLSGQQGSPILNYREHAVVRSPCAMDFASTPFGPSLFRHYTCMLRHCDFLHLHFPYPIADLYYLLQNSNKPALVTYHSDIVKQKYLFFFYRPLMRAFLSKMKCIVATSPNYLESSPVLRKYKHKVRIIPLGIAPSVPENASATEVSPEQKARIEGWRKKLGSDFFFFVGVFRYYKGLHYLLQAAKLTNYRFVIAGSGPLTPSIEEYISRNMLNNVRLVGRISEEDKDALLRLCKAVVFPSHLRSEAFGITLLEGAMHGKPLVSCEIGTGTSYVNLDEETGFVVPPRNPYAIAQALHVIHYDEKRRSHFQEAARSRFYNNFTASRMAQSYYRLYNELSQTA